MTILQSRHTFTGSFKTLVLINFMPATRSVHVQTKILP